MPHFLYIPVVIAALGGGRKAGVLVGAVAGLLLGPLMPLDTSTGEAQLLNWWLIRTAFFIGVGVVVGEGRRRLLAMEATRQRFVSAIAHEVRTPLSAVLGFSQILNDRATEFDADEILEFVDFINQEVTELHDIIEGYIVAGRLDDSALVFEPKDIQLDKTVEQALSHLPAQVLTERISFDLSPARCWADPTRVRRSVRALVAHCLACCRRRRHGLDLPDWRTCDRGSAPPRLAHHGGVEGSLRPDDGDTARGRQTSPGGDGPGGGITARSSHGRLPHPPPHRRGDDT